MAKNLILETNCLDLELFQKAEKIGLVLAFALVVVVSVLLTVRFVDYLVMYLYLFIFGSHFYIFIHCLFQNAMSKIMHPRSAIAEQIFR